MKLVAWVFSLSLLAGFAQADTVKIKLGEQPLSAELSLAEGKTIQDGVVLMLHGTLAHNRMEIMVALEELLNDYGYSTLAINLSYALPEREGMLDCAIEHKHKHEDAINEIYAWMSWLQGKKVERIALLGHSRGGNQAVWYAMDNDKAALTHVISIAPMTWNEKKASDDYHEKYGRQLFSIMAEASRKKHTGELLTDIGFIYCKDAKASAAAVHSYYVDDQRKDTPAIMSYVKAPLMVVTGTEDDVVENLDQRVAKLAAEGKVEHLEIDGADHFFRDLYAEDMVDGIVEFIGWE